MTKLKFAIVGCGRIGNRHAEHINNVGVLQAVFDIEKEGAQAIGEKYQANVYTSIEELLEKEKGIDVVAVCSPNGLHAVHSIASLNAGFNVICEKPMAIDVQDCGEMIKASEKIDKRLFAVKQNRFNPPVHAIKN